jgi:hypothetical protein
VDGPHALDEKTGDQCMRDVFRHALVAEIVKMEIIACHQLQIGPVLGDEPHCIIAADVKNIFLGGDSLQAVAYRGIIRAPGEADGILHPDEHDVDPVLLQHGYNP